MAPFENFSANQARTVRALACKLIRELHARLISARGNAPREAIMRPALSHENVVVNRSLSRRPRRGVYPRRAMFLIAAFNERQDRSFPVRARFVINAK